MSRRPGDGSLWLDRVGEASLLEPREPQRQAVEAEVARRGGLARAQWLALLEEGERLRLALARLDPPEGLAERLLRIPDEHPLRAPKDTRPGRAARWLAVAALVAAVGMALWLLTDRHTDPATDLAVLVLRDHRETHAWDVEADRASTLVAALQPRIPFPVSLPDLGPGLAPVGGRRCTLATHPAAFTAWRAQHGRVTLIQVRRADFAIPAVRGVQRARGGPGEDVLLLASDEYAWVVAADDPADLAAVERALTSSQGR